MALNADELSKSFVALSERVSGLAETLTQTAGQLQGSGTPPAESLLDEIAKVRTDFVDVRHRVLDAARSLSINVPAMSEIDSIRALEPVLETVAQAQAAEEKKAALAEARARVMAVLDRVLTVTHMDGPNFGAGNDPRAVRTELQIGDSLLREAQDSTLPALSDVPKKDPVAILAGKEPAVRTEPE